MYDEISRQQFKNQFEDLNLETIGNLNTFCPKPSIEEE